MESKSDPSKNTCNWRFPTSRSAFQSLQPADATINAMPVKLPPFGQVTLSFAPFRGQQTATTFQSQQTTTSFRSQVTLTLDDITADRVQNMAVSQSRPPGHAGPHCFGASKLPRRFGASKLPQHFGISELPQRFGARKLPRRFKARKLPRRFKAR